MPSTEPTLYLRDKGFKIAGVKTTDPPRSGVHSGYGARIPTSRLIELEGIPHRWYRVYVIQYSNSGSAYILKNKQRLFIHDSDLPDEIKEVL